MKVGVLSDTHISIKSRYLPGEIFTIFKGADLIIHCGDICVINVIEELETIAPVHAVAGNVDPFGIYNRFGDEKKIEVEDITILITHGNQGVSSALENVKKRAGDADLIIFGHSHSPYSGKFQNTYFFNPGSPTDYKRPGIYRKQPSVGLLTIEGTNIESQVIYF